MGQQYHYGLFMKANNMETIRSYRPQDLAAVYALWQSTLGATWPLSRQTFSAITGLPFAHRENEPAAPGAGGNRTIVAADRHEIIGFLSAQRARLPNGSLRAGVQVVTVAPEHQRQGIGRALLATAQRDLRARGATALHVGQGGSRYFWPGVPTNLPHAAAFFRRSGWNFHWQCFDMVGDLRRLALDPAPLQRIEAQGYRVETPTATQVAALLAFEAAHFPHWLAAFRARADAGQLANLLIATDQQEEVVGSLALFDDQLGEGDGVWRALLGERMGGLGVLGVRADHRERGVGLALAAAATRQLQGRGVEHAFVGYTTLDRFYGRLGYRVWRRYHMSDPLPLVD